MLHTHRAERADTLVEALAGVLARPDGDPFVPEVVSVPTRGIERWVAQRLSHRLGTSEGREDGVCAHVVFPPPHRLVAQALGEPDDDPWRPERLVWPLLEVIDDCRGEPWCAALDAYLGADDASSTRRGRRFAAARHLAGLFAAYGEHRPATVRAWAGGDDADADGDASDLRWQPELWRRLRAAMPAPAPAERLEPACRALEEHPGAVDLPARLSLFGPTRLSAGHLRVLTALARHREVHLWLPHPSPALWDRVAAVGTPDAPDATAPRRAVDPTVDTAAHPLLRSLGRDVRELQLRLAGLGAREHHHAGTVPERRTLLGRLQQDLRHDRAPEPAEHPGDDTVQVHVCHGADRQVEVLREVILGLLRDDPTLEPRDVVVMCPDIERFAPLVTASFGRHTDAPDPDAHPGHRLQVRLADRALTQVNPLLGVVVSLLDLADARVSASQLLDLAESEPVRRRFGLDDDDLERLRELVRDAGVRWGLDEEHRRPYKLGGFGENTWERGLDRLLLGVAVSEDERVWLDSALPLDDVDSSDVERVGRLGEFVDRVAAVLDALTGERPLDAWIGALRHGLDALTATTPADTWQLAQARAELADVLGSAASAPVLTLHDVRAVLADRLRGRPTRANFRTGSLTVATLMPMRSVPHRVICLLGLDDGVFPRSTRADGDDVLARDPRVGERDAAAEDRQLLLDAVMAAGEHLVVVHSGRDERTNEERPPAVPVAELLDTLDASVRIGGGPARRHVIREHPLQPFAEPNFRADAPFSFDAAQLAGARALRARPTLDEAPSRLLLDRALPARPDTEVSLEDLVRFLEHPVRGFLRQRLGVIARDEEEDPAEGLPVEMDSLARWGTGDRLLRDRLAGLDAATCMQAEVRRGALPPGQLGAAVMTEVGHQVEPLVAAADPLWRHPARDVDVRVVLDDATVLSGSVPGVRDGVLAAVSFSSLAPKHRLRAWVQLLALTAAHPIEGWTATTIGKGGRDGALSSSLAAVPPTRARQVLTDLVGLRRRGLCEPLPLVGKASEAYAAKRHENRGEKDALRAARSRWVGSRYPGEGAEAPHVLVWGRDRELPDLPGPTPRGERTPFGGLAMALWAPLLEAEGQGGWAA